MKLGTPVVYDETDALGIYAEEVEQASEDDLWFLPGPMDDEPDYLPPGPRAEPRETEVLDDWRKAEGGQAARLARVAGRIGALDDRLKRGPEGWRHRLALMEAADLSWHTGEALLQNSVGEGFTSGIHAVRRSAYGATFWMRPARQSG